MITTAAFEAGAGVQQAGCSDSLARGQGGEFLNLVVGVL